MNFYNYGFILIHLTVSLLLDAEVVSSSQVKPSELQGEAHFHELTSSGNTYSIPSFSVWRISSLPWQLFRSTNMSHLGVITVCGFSRLWRMCSLGVLLVRKMLLFRRVQQMCSVPVQCFQRQYRAWKSSCSEVSREDNLCLKDSKTSIFKWILLLPTCIILVPNRITSFSLLVNCTDSASKERKSWPCSKNDIPTSWSSGLGELAACGAEPENLHWGTAGVLAGPFSVDQHFKNIIFF